MTTARIPIPYAEVAAFCRKWRIKELALFGSVLRDDFRPESDIDVLVTFLPGVSWLWGGYSEMAEELGAILGRKVDLVSRPGIEQSRNPFLKKNILGNVESIYVA
jgi:predicted nucleotidyltransferase